MTHATIESLPAFSQVDGSPLYCVTLSGKAMCIGCANHGRRLGCTADDDCPDWFLVELRPHLGGETCHHCRRPIHTTPKRDAIPLANGYTEILEDDGKPGIRIRNAGGGIDVFQVRDSCTSDGRVLEFCYSIATPSLEG